MLRRSQWASHPIALRERVVAFVEEGHGHREAARHFRVSPRFVNDLVILNRETGSLTPRRQGHLGGGELSTHHGFVSSGWHRLANLTLDELCVELSRAWRPRPSLQCRTASPSAGAEP
jgi:transposase